MGFLNGSPNKAFIYQDHDAHIAVHTTFLQDPMIAQQMGQNPMAQQMASAVQAHIASHLAFLYRQKIQDQLGMPLPAPDSQLPEEAEVQLSQLVAQASTQLLQLNLANAQQQKAQQQSQDPIIQMQQQELQLKGQELQRKAMKDMADVQLNKKRLEVDALKAVAQLNNQKKENKANRNFEAIKAVAAMNHEKNLHKKDSALEILKHENPRSKGE
jgi:hypothetical protein